MLTIWKNEAFNLLTDVHFSHQCVTIDVNIFEFIIAINYNYA